MMQLIVHCHRNEVEQLSLEIEEAGALSLTLTDEYDDPILEPTKGSNPLWPHVVMTALFNDDEALKEVQILLQNTYPHLRVSTELLPEQDWERVCMDDFKPQQFGQNLWICPSWHTPPNAQAINIILDPGLAFGTGNHATTALCLTWLEQAALSQQTVVDYGCGSGILAIAAIKLGAAHVFAIDIDDQALIATKNNAEINQIKAEQMTLGLPEVVPPPCDLVLANILLTPLMSLKNHFYSLLKPKGKLVVSGLLAEQAPILIETYQTHFMHVLTRIQGDWALLEFIPNEKVATHY